MRVASSRGSRGSAAVRRARKDARAPPRARTQRHTGAQGSSAHLEGLVDGRRRRARGRREARRAHHSILRRRRRPSTITAAAARGSARECRGGRRVGGLLLLEHFRDRRHDARRRRGGAAEAQRRYGRRRRGRRRRGGGGAEDAAGSRDGPAALGEVVGSSVWELVSRPSQHTQSCCKPAFTNRSCNPAQYCEERQSCSTHQADPPCFVPQHNPRPPPSHHPHPPRSFAGSPQTPHTYAMAPWHMPAAPQSTPPQPPTS